MPHFNAEQNTTSIAESSTGHHCFIGVVGGKANDLGNEVTGDLKDSTSRGVVGTKIIFLQWSRKRDEKEEKEVC